MPTVNDIAPLLGTVFDEQRIESFLGVRGRSFETEYDEGHPEDRWRYYIVRSIGLQMLLADDDTIQALFFSVDGDVNVDPYPWLFEWGPRSGLVRADILAWYGTPSRSGPPARFTPGGWDRFDQAFAVGPMHINYRADERRTVSVITLMTETTAP